MIENSQLGISLEQKPFQVSFFHLSFKTVQVTLCMSVHLLTRKIIRGPVFAAMVFWIVSCSLNWTKFISTALLPQGPHSHILMTGGVRRIFLGLTFWPKWFFLGLWKTPGFFWVAKTTQGFFWYCVFHQLKSTIT